ncbi:MAG TPA: Smr/MutS family protein [Parvibaculum sp.]|jgi:DNA-nicking Smr family endonuclease
MEGEDKPKRRRHRSLSEDEHKLWKAVVKDTRPLSRGKIIPIPEHGVAPTKAAGPKIAPVPKPVSSVPRIRSVPEIVKLAPAPPPLNTLDRRTSQRLARGQIEAEARLDLHGMRQDEAQPALLHFLTRTRAGGLRCVLVITGKGESPFARHTLHSTRYHEASDHSGVLRSALPQWLGEPQFRVQVSGFQPAHPRHGGGGAFYVWLRKR